MKLTKRTQTVNYVHLGALHLDGELSGSFGEIEGGQAFNQLIGEFLGLVLALPYTSHIRILLCNCQALRCSECFRFGIARL